MAGRPPFTGKDLDGIIDANKEAKIDFNIPKLKSAGNDAMTLLKRMLDPNPDTRISAQEALEHCFFDGIPKLASTALASSKKIEIQVKQASEEECNINFGEDEEESSRSIAIYQERYD